MNKESSTLNGTVGTNLHGVAGLSKNYPRSSRNRRRRDVGCANPAGVMPIRHRIAAWKRDFGAAIPAPKVIHRAASYALAAVHRPNRCLTHPQASSRMQNGDLCVSRRKFTPLRASPLISSLVRSHPAVRALNSAQVAQPVYLHWATAYGLAPKVRRQRHDQHGPT